ncbi:hypothetical protein HDU76_013515 [Blyttiomyces sp. JEL0837]|nr:hypothetical protein HDU76_013515 [Blyttiomyces sp. JEL0837]
MSFIQIEKAYSLKQIAPAAEYATIRVPKRIKTTQGLLDPANVAVIPLPSSVISAPNSPSAGPLIVARSSIGLARPTLPSCSILPVPPLLATTWITQTTDSNRVAALASTLKNSSTALITRSKNLAVVPYWYGVGAQQRQQRIAVSESLVDFNSSLHMVHQVSRTQRLFHRFSWNCHVSPTYSRRQSKQAAVLPIGPPVFEEMSASVNASPLSLTATLIMDAKLSLPKDLFTTHATNTEPSTSTSPSLFPPALAAPSPSIKSPSGESTHSAVSPAKPMKSTASSGSRTKTASPKKSVKKSKETSNANASTPLPATTTSVSAIPSLAVATAPTPSMDVLDNTTASAADPLASVNTVQGSIALAPPSVPSGPASQSAVTEDVVMAESVSSALVQGPTALVTPAVSSVPILQPVISNDVVMGESQTLSACANAAASLLTLSTSVVSHGPIVSAASANISTQPTGTSNDVAMEESVTLAVSTPPTLIPSVSHMSISQAVTATGPVTRKLARPKLRSKKAVNGATVPTNSAPTLTATSASSSSGVGPVASMASSAGGSHIAVSSGSNDAAAALLSLSTSANLRTPTTLATRTVPTQQIAITNDVTMGEGQTPAVPSTTSATPHSSVSSTSGATPTNAAAASVPSALFSVPTSTNGNITAPNSANVVTPPSTTTSFNFIPPTTRIAPSFRIPVNAPSFGVPTHVKNVVPAASPSGLTASTSSTANPFESFPERGTDSAVTAPAPSVAVSADVAQPVAKRDLAQILFGPGNDVSESQSRGAPSTSGNTRSLDLNNVNNNNNNVMINSRAAAHTPPASTPFELFCKLVALSVFRDILGTPLAGPNVNCLAAWIHIATSLPIPNPLYSLLEEFVTRDPDYFNWSTSGPDDIFQPSTGPLLRAFCLWYARRPFPIAGNGMDGFISTVFVYKNLLSPPTEEILAEAIIAQIIEMIDDGSILAFGDGVDLSFLDLLRSYPGIHGVAVDGNMTSTGVFGDGFGNNLGFGNVPGSLSSSKNNNRIMTDEEFAAILAELQQMPLVTLLIITLLVEPERLPQVMIKDKLPLQHILKDKLHRLLLVQKHQEALATDDNGLLMPLPQFGNLGLSFTTWSDDFDAARLSAEAAAAAALLGFHG